MSPHPSIWIRSLLLALAALLPLRAAADPFADAVVDFSPGSNAGFGAENLPDVVLGPPRGGGDRQGSSDVLSLGNGGVVTLHFADPVICDGEGPDFTVFENAFFAGSLIFSELATVAVSQDGEAFVEFPYDPETLAGLAGQRPVFSHPDNGIDPTDPAVSGGDLFDLATIGLPWIAFVRITDAGDSIDDPGNAIPAGTSGGFDLDAIAAVHPCSIQAETPTPVRQATATPTPTAPPNPDGDLDGDGDRDREDLALLVAEIFDGDGDRADDTGGGDVTTPSSPDLNSDDFVNAADIAAFLAL